MLTKIKDFGCYDSGYWILYSKKDERFLLVKDPLIVEDTITGRLYDITGRVVLETEDFYEFKISCDDFPEEVTVEGYDTVCDMLKKENPPELIEILRSINIMD